MRTMLTHFAILPLISVFCFYLRPCPCAVPAPGTAFYDRGSGVTEIFKKDDIGVDDGTNFLGQIRGNQKFLIIRHEKNKADLTVTVGGRLLYTMPDEAFDLPWRYFNPGETYKGYDFYLSPTMLAYSSCVG